MSRFPKVDTAPHFVFVISDEEQVGSGAIRTS